MNVLRGGNVGNENTLVEFKEKRYNNYICKKCGITNCFEHCNNCFAEIKWTNYLGDPYYETNKNGKRVRYAYNNDDSVHRCLKRGGGKWINKELQNEYPIDEYRTFTRFSGPRFKCNVCNYVDDLPVMLDFHVNDSLCKAKLMEQLFKEKPNKYIPIIDKDGLDKFMEKK